MPRLGPNLKLGLLLFVVAFGVGAPLLYGGATLVAQNKPAAPAGEESTAPAGPVSVTIVAKDLKFDKGTITASAGSDVTVTLDNQDAGVLHSVAFYTSNRATSKIFVGDTFAGVAQRDFTFKAPASPGNYYFRCDVHPDTMNGAFQVR